jgi:hypothetical protein
MKKTLLTLLVIASLFISCSSNDDTPVDTPVDPIIGKWQDLKTIYHLDNGGVYQEDETNQKCNFLSTREFLADGTVVHFFYTGQNDCILEVNDYEYFNWSNEGDGNYTVTLKRADINEEVFTEKAFFYDNNNKFYSKDNDTGTANSEPFTGSEYHYKKI